LKSEDDVLALRNYSVYILEKRINHISLSLDWKAGELGDHLPDAKAISRF
jgi:hypothetical protein